MCLTHPKTKMSSFVLTFRFISFQDQQSNGKSLNSYVVASSVGNFTIKNLQDPVKIEIAHLEYKVHSFFFFFFQQGWLTPKFIVIPVFQILVIYFSMSN